MTRKPLVNAFFFCDRVLHEADGVMSAIRIIDLIGVSALSEVEGKPLAVAPTTLFIGLKSGDYKGVCEIALVGKRPSGKALKRQAMSVDLEGEQKGVNVVVQAHLHLPEEGVYWFELYLNDELATRTPLTVVLVPKPTSSLPGPADEQARTPSPTGSAPRAE